MDSNQPAIILIAVLLALVMAGCASDKQIVVHNVKRISGYVTALDINKSTLSILNDEGILVTLKINKLANNSDVSLVGKDVDVQLYRSFFFTLCNLDTVSRPEEAVERAEIKGIKETGSTAIKAHVERIDFDDNVLFLKWVDGTIVPLEIKENAHTLYELSKGDQVLINYSQSMTIFEQKKRQQSPISGL